MNYYHYILYMIILEMGIHANVYLLINKIPG